MRIISGSLKGKKIEFIRSSTTRPLRDYVRENIFNILNHSKVVPNLLKDSIILDLYSGAGSFGIECISRGAKEVTFFEKDFTANKILRKNLKEFKLENKTIVFEEDVLTSLYKLKKKFNIIFFDPPFADKLYVQNILNIKQFNIYSKNHLVIIHRENNNKDFLDKILKILLIKTYGRSKIIFGYIN